MGVDVTRADIRRMVRGGGDYQEPFITDAMLNEWLERSKAKWWDLVILHDSSRIRSADTIHVLSGTASYPLADDYYQVKGVSVADARSPTGWAPLQNYQWQERHDYALSASGNSKLETLWDIQEKTLYLWPKPAWSESVLVEYFPTPPELSDDGTTFDVISQTGLEWLVMDLLVKCALKGADEFGHKGWTAERDRCQMLLQSAAPQLKGGHPKVAVSIYDRGSGRRRRSSTRSW